MRTFERPMGLAVASGRLTVGTRNQVWKFRDAPDIAPQVEPPGTHDACYLPRQCHMTGDIYIHEMAWIANELWLVNTRFSCLCTLAPEYSFVPRWRPPSSPHSRPRTAVTSTAFVPSMAGRDS